MIAVEQYRSAEIAPLAYAQNDARAMVDVFETLGFAEAEQLVLIDHQATKTTIDSKLFDLIKHLKIGDVFYLFFAGRGASVENRPYLFCYDTDPKDVPRTAVDLQDVFDTVAICAGRQNILFIDASNLPGEFAAGLAPVRPNPSKKVTEIRSKSHLPSAENYVCFTASQAFGPSYRSDKLKQGLWTHHLLLALNGQAEIGQVTRASLDQYLGKAVSLSVRNTFADARVQTPQSVGYIAADFVIANVKARAESVVATAPLRASNLDRVLMTSMTTAPIKGLSGFTKGTHRVPDYFGPSSSTYVAKLAADELKEDINRIARASREILGFSRKEISASIDVGSGSVISPGFEYCVSVVHNHDDTKQVVWNRDVRNVKLDLWGSKSLDLIFNDVFDTIELGFSKKISVQDLIDRLEAAKDGSMTVEYEDTDPNRCTILLRAFAGRIEVTQTLLKLISRQTSNPSNLIEQFRIAKRLID